MMSGLHNWCISSHARPTYCNVCREALSGVTFHGLSCGVCKFKSHKKCATRAPNLCKWITLANVGDSIIEEEDGLISMSHQWLEGNLPVSGRCSVCDRACGSVRRLQDFRCLWCKAMVHSACRDLLPRRCSLSQCRVSVIPPTAISSMDSEGHWEASARPPATSPLLVFVNSKSGDNQGVKFLRRFKQLLNPAQVFDLMNGGPYPGLRLFENFDQFRVLVCGGDGSINWVMAMIDKLDLHRKCQVGVLPLGTGNDLARVLGWGSAITDDNQLPAIIERLEHSQIKMLDRWSIMVYEEPTAAASVPDDSEDPGADDSEDPGADDSEDVESPRTVEGEPRINHMSQYENSVADHLSKILHSGDHATVISSAKVLLCETINNLVIRVAEGSDSSEKEPESDSIAQKCSILNDKLKLLLKTLEEEEEAASVKLPDEVTISRQRERESLPSSAKASPDRFLESCNHSSARSSPANLSRSSDEEANNKPLRLFKLREALMSRANSLKKAVRQIIEHTESAVDEQINQSEEMSHLVSSHCQSEEVSHRVSHTACSHPPISHSHSTAPNTAPLCSTSSPRHPSSCHVSHTLGMSPAQPLDSIPDASPLVSPEPSPQPDSSPLLSRQHFLGYLSKDVGSSRDGSESPRLPSRKISNMSTVGCMSREKSPDVLNTQPPLFPILRVGSSIANNLAGGSFISKMLLLNADALCAPVSPLMEDNIPMDNYTEKRIMNNYFGIGLDAKIVYEFNMKREEYPDKCRSRTKNFMWFGLLSSKEIIRKTYRNLERCVLLECDGRRLPLPNLQGIVVLNIPSYMSGTNFWGNSRTKEGETFVTQSFDDRLLEVVAVFSCTQMGLSRIVNLQHHRIAQCRTVKITIKGNKCIPVQVDGEAWQQPPGVIKLVHKNRAQMLTRDKEFESKVKSWSERLKSDRFAAPAPLIGSCSGCSPAVMADPATAEEMRLVHSINTSTTTLLDYINRMDQHDSDAAKNCPDFMRLSLQVESKKAKVSSLSETNSQVPKGEILQFADSARLLCVAIQEHLGQDQENHKSVANELITLTKDILADVDQITQLQPDDENTPSTSNGSRSKNYSKFKLLGVGYQKKLLIGSNAMSKLRGTTSAKVPVALTSSKKVQVQGGGNWPCASHLEAWGTEEVGAWLMGVDLGEYREAFMMNDIRGAELAQLERQDLRDLGVSKVGHLKRLEVAITQLNRTAKGQGQ